MIQDITVQSTNSQLGRYQKATDCINMFHIYQFF